MQSLGTVEEDDLLDARVRMIAEMIGAGANEAPAKKASTTLKIPLEEVTEDGINLSLSMTGSHFIIKI